MHKARRDEAPRLPCQRQEDSPRNLGRPSYWPGRASGSALLQKYLENGGDESDDPTSIYPRTSKLPWQARRLTCLTLSTEADLDRRGRAIFTPTRTSPNSPLLPPLPRFSLARPTDSPTIPNTPRENDTTGSWSDEISVDMESPFTNDALHRVLFGRLSHSSIQPDGASLALLVYHQ